MFSLPTLRVVIITLDLDYLLEHEALGLGETGTTVSLPALQVGVGTLDFGHEGFWPG